MKNIIKANNSINVLIVGAGGIGCELLKVLTKTGFTTITIVDLDSIEMTNLNRQFYFRRHHAKMSKVEVAAKAITRIHP